MNKQETIKPAQQPEQSEVCETCGKTNIEHRRSGADSFACPSFKPATPPASEPSRDAAIEAAKNYWILQGQKEFDNHRCITDLMADFAIHFARQRAEVAHEHDALCTIAYDDGQRAERAKVAALKIALADAIRCPMGVCPDSAVGLLTVEELKDAENRRVEGKSPAIKHIGLTGEAK